MKIVEFFESKGVKVKITTVQPYEKKLEAIKLFNKTLKEKYPQYCMDISPIFTTANGNEWKEGMKASDNLHLSKEARTKVGKYFEENKTVV